MEKTNLEIFKALNAQNVKEFSKKKGNFDYLSWAKAWDLLKRECPDATYVIKVNNDGLPYFASELGIMVFTSMTINGLTHDMWLSVMDENHNALKLSSYIIKKRKSKQNGGGEYEVTVPAATMNDINRTLMRCLTKNIAMFGLGLHLYEGEDITTEEYMTAKEDAYQQNIDMLQTYVRGAKTPADLSALWSNNVAYQKDDTFRGAIFGKLYSFVKACKTEAEIGKVYSASPWAQHVQEFLDVCCDRKVEIKQDSVA